MWEMWTQPVTYVGLAATLAWAVVSGRREERRETDWIIRGVQWILGLGFIAAAAVIWLDASAWSRLVPEAFPYRESTVYLIAAWLALGGATLYSPQREYAAMSLMVLLVATFPFLLDAALTRAALPFEFAVSRIPGPVPTLEGWVLIATPAISAMWLLWAFLWPDDE